MLNINNLTIEFNEKGKQVRVVDHFSLQMAHGEILGIVGESGSGKTMTALSVMGLLSGDAQIIEGSIEFEGNNLLKCTEKELRKFQGNQISMIFQEPMTSLNPVMAIGRQVEESLKIHTNLSGVERKEKVIQILADVELDEPTKLYSMYPHQLSGGMRQRVMIAAALVCIPKLLVADEPTTALDVTIQAQILLLLQKLSKKYEIGILFISHDLGVVKKICERVLVMRSGKVVEQGDVAEVFYNPKEEYTKRLMASVPRRNNSIKNTSFNHMRSEVEQ